jgi:hypothetical protein
MQERASAPSKFPPIVAIGQSVTVIRAVTDSLKIPNLQLKITKDGIKLFVQTADSFRQVKEALIAKSIQFYSHQLRDDQLSKFVIYGLPKIDTKDINGELASLGIKPVQIKELNIKKKRNDDHCIYLVSFLKKDRISLLNLQDIKAICQVRITWQVYRNLRTGPTQCTNCLRLGHGASHCKVLPKCIRCAGDHKSQSCPLIQTSDGKTIPKIAHDLLKCALCNGNHTANYSKCPKRIEFATLRAGWTKKKATTPSAKFKPARQLEDFHFPPLSNSQGPAWTYTPSTPAPPRVHVIPPQTGTNQPSNDLLSSQELFKIFLDITSQLSKAKTRQEQILIMMDIAIKYAVPFNG